MINVTHELRASCASLASLLEQLRAFNPLRQRLYADLFNGEPIHRN